MAETAIRATPETSRAPTSAPSTSSVRTARGRVTSLMSTCSMRVRPQGTANAVVTCPEPGTTSVAVTASPVQGAGPMSSTVLPLTSTSRGDHPGVAKAPKGVARLPVARSSRSCPSLVPPARVTSRSPDSFATSASSTPGTCTVVPVPEVAAAASTGCAAGAPDPLDVTAPRTSTGPCPGNP